MLHDYYMDISNIEMHNVKVWNHLRERFPNISSLTNYIERNQNETQNETQNM